MGIGERLRAIREQKEMSQGDIEDRTGLLRCYISRVEHGHTIPSIETLDKLTRALGVTMSELFSENRKAARPLELPEPKPEKLDRSSSNNLRRLTQAYQRMTPRHRVLLVTIASKLTKAR